MAEADLQEYLRLTREVDALIAAGKGDSPEHEAMCDLMDGPWYRMTAEEHERFRRWDRGEALDAPAKGPPTDA